MRNLFFVLVLTLVLFGVFPENSIAQGWYVDLMCGVHSAQESTVYIDIDKNCGFSLAQKYTVTRQDWRLIPVNTDLYKVSLRLWYVSDVVPQQEVIKTVSVIQPSLLLRILAGLYWLGVIL